MDEKKQMKWNDGASAVQHSVVKYLEFELEIEFEIHELRLDMSNLSKYSYQIRKTNIHGNWWVSKMFFFCQWFFI